MRRRATIIWMDMGLNGRFPGSALDAVALKRYLLSPLGGAWEAEEVMTLQNPNHDDLIRLKKRHERAAEYTVTIYSGQGQWTAKGEELKVKLKDGPVDLAALKSNAPQELILTDAQRQFKTTSGQQWQQPSQWEGGDETYRLKCRQLYDEAIRKAQNCFAILHGVDKSGHGMETEEGSCYFTGLICAAQEFGYRPDDEVVLHAIDAHEFARVFVRERFGSVQNLKEEWGRKVGYFPWGVRGVW